MERGGMRLSAQREARGTEAALCRARNNAPRPRNASTLGQTGARSLSPLYLLSYILGLVLLLRLSTRPTFTPVTTLVLPWLQQRVTTFDAWALLFPALDETILRNIQKDTRNKGKRSSPA